MTVVSLGEAGTSDPSFLSRSRNARLGCATWCICGSAADAVTRSIAAFGQTHTFRPSSANTPVSARNTSNDINRSITLNLDRNDLLHDQVAHELKEDGDSRHLITDRVLDKELDVFPVCVEHQKRHRHRNDGQRGGGNAAVRADGLDSAAQ